MTVLYTRWRFNNKTVEFYLPKKLLKIRETISELKLILIDILLTQKIMKKFVKLCLHFKTPFILTIFFFTENAENSKLRKNRKNYKKEKFFKKKFVKLCLHSKNPFDEIFHKKNHQKFLVKVCLRSSFTLQNSFHFDEIFHRKYKIPFDAI